MSLLLASTFVANRSKRNQIAFFFCFLLTEEFGLFVEEFWMDDRLAEIYPQACGLMLLLFAPESLEFAYDLQLLD